MRGLWGGAKSGRSNGSSVGGAVAQGERVLLDLAKKLHDAPILEPCLVVEIATKLARHARDRSLCDLAGFEPIVVDSQETTIGLELAHGGESKGSLEHLREFVLPLRRHEQVPERPEGCPLIG